MTIRIGTAGWSVAAGAPDLFGGEGSHLERYARMFDAVEINSSFYRPHRADTYRRWAGSVPRDFRFAVKCPRVATHERRLAGCGEVLRRFAGEIAGLEGKLGVVLVQLPPTLQFDEAIASAFFAELGGLVPTALACEPRHGSWFEERAETLLAGCGVARVAADPSLAARGGEPGGDLRVAYFRLHGSPRIYRSTYGAEQCAAIAARLLDTGCDAWCIFDNTASGAAIGDALLTREAVRARQ